MSTTITACQPPANKTQVPENEPHSAHYSSAAAKPDFSSITDVNEKKAAFFSYLRPAVEQANRDALNTREHLLSLSKKQTLSTNDVAYLRELAVRYDVDFGHRPPDSTWFAQMLSRVDIIPVSLVLVQAAKESGWGTSRFAVEGNNYFGQWCYQRGCGMVPNQRSSDKTHEVAVFDSVSDSVNAYFININRNDAYAGVREIRRQLREKGDMLDAAMLADGLTRYSERGQIYVDEVKDMLRHNNKFWRQG
ncbi:glucosaminidase domain-containing protein [Veronia pacifica]|uniref:Mannosyl-glycoprotein endo-beta-N-acetylglucosamidase-like domain-containing protein n=1 Tax=Veronia pacifica TaxID=1080227 RepID=A0A1C3EEU2_9GAMM|nr:glucosaminidase domain-containing protein [Veronia pacifica]ODA31756.1 hypothetical protein A8L45_15370 [Veronia pacifica]